MIKKIISVLLVLTMATGFYASADEVLYSATTAEDVKKDTVNSVKLEVPAKSCILIEATTGKILYEENADEVMPPASITKVMTLLLVMEALDEGKIHLSDTVTASQHACSMGGTQIWLEPNEQMTVEDLLKATAVVSANDASVALGEHIAGSEPNFVAMMNERAKELGMKNTVFKNATGLDADGHCSTARDISIMSRELLKHKDITKYTTIWMDSLRNGKNELVNTNKLVRHYEGTTGLKTGTTDGAGACLSASAKREGLELIAVTMGSSNSKERFAAAKTLLNYGFATYSIATPQVNTESLTPIEVLHGVKNNVCVKVDELSGVVVKKGEEKNIEQKITLVKNLEAPVEKNQTVGELQVTLNNETIATYDIKTTEKIDELGIFEALKKLLMAVVCLK